MSEQHKGVVVIVDEEYGYRHWLWIYPGTKEELIADWKVGKAPLDYMDPSVKNANTPYQGVVVNCQREIAEELTDNEAFYVGYEFMYAHVFDHADTYIMVDDVQYPHYKFVAGKGGLSGCYCEQCKNAVTTTVEH